MSFFESRKIYFKILKVICFIMRSNIIDFGLRSLISCSSNTNGQATIKEGYRYRLPLLTVRMDLKSASDLSEVRKDFTRILETVVAAAQNVKYQQTKKLNNMVNKGCMAGK